jgi:hypothetical protein
MNKHILRSRNARALICANPESNLGVGEAGAGTVCRVSFTGDVNVAGEKSGNVVRRERDGGTGVMGLVKGST